MIRIALVLNLSAVVLLTAAGGVTAQAERVRAIAPAAGGANTTVNLPFVVNDNVGNQWMVYQGGWLRQQGNMPVYSQAAMLLVNGQHIQSHANQARRDDKTGEIIFENMNAPSLTVTRRVLIDPAGGFVRYIDIFQNSQAQELSVTINYQTNFNYGVQSTANVTDPKSKDKPIAWVAQMHAPRAVVEIYGGRGAKQLPDIQWMPENNMLRAAHELKIPGKKAVALVHVHSTAASQDAGTQFVNTLKDKSLLADVPRDIRRLIVNFSGGASLVDDREVLRGEMFDVVELRSGDLVNGTLQEASYALEAFYGKVDLPAERVVGLLNVGQFRPRQLVVTVDGEVFGGKLGKETIALQLSSGQVTQIPLSQVSRIGYRKRPSEPEEWTFEKPMVLLRSGDRIGIDLPQQPIEVLTRYGTLQLQPQALAAVAFQAEDHGVHQIYLTDGSAFAGLVSAPQFQFILSGLGGQVVTFPTPTLRRLQFAAQLPDPDVELPTLALANEDVLVGALAGQLKLDTTFDTITINGPEIRALSRAPDAPLDVQVTLWDQTIVSGQLQEPQLRCALKSGLQITVPVALVEQYSNPNPRPSAGMVERIRAVVAELSAEDWRQRESAEQQLIAMGPVVSGVLREMLATQPPEAQQRIESILKQFGKPDAPAPVIVDQ